MVEMFTHMRGIAAQGTIFTGVLITSSIDAIDSGLKIILLLLTIVYTVYKILDLRSKRNKRLKD